LLNANVHWTREAICQLLSFRPFQIPAPVTFGLTLMVRGARGGLGFLKLIKLLIHFLHVLLPYPAKLFGGTSQLLEMLACPLAFNKLQASPDDASALVGRADFLHFVGVA